MVVFTQMSRHLKLQLPNYLNYPDVICNEWRILGLIYTALYMGDVLRQDITHCRNLEYRRRRPERQLQGWI
jgi:hypothetical protein